MWVLYLLLSALILLLAVVLIRTAAFKPRPQFAVKEEKIDFDKEKSINALQQLIRCKTVSYYDKALEDEAEFKKFIELLPKLYPEVFKVCEYKELPDRALLFKWKGKKVMTLLF